MLSILMTADYAAVLHLVSICFFLNHDSSDSLQTWGLTLLSKAVHWKRRVKIFLVLVDILTGLLVWSQIVSGKLRQGIPVRHRLTGNAVVSATPCRTYGSFIRSAQKAKRRFWLLSSWNWKPTRAKRSSPRLDGPLLYIRCIFAENVPDSFVGL
jgi:hypothetical protein